MKGGAGYPANVLPELWRGPPNPRYDQCLSSILEHPTSQNGPSGQPQSKVWALNALPRRRDCQPKWGNRTRPNATPDSGLGCMVCCVDFRLGRSEERPPRKVRCLPLMEAPLRLWFRLCGPGCGWLFFGATTGALSKAQGRVGIRGNWPCAFAYH